MTKAVDAQAQTVVMQGTEIRMLMARNTAFWAVVDDGFSNRKAVVDHIRGGNGDGMAKIRKCL